MMEVIALAMELIPRAGLDAARLPALRPGELSALAGAREHALTAAGRVEFEGGATEALAEALLDSPWMDDSQRLETLCTLTELFYALKNETGDRIADGDLIARIRACFDDCHGVAELVADRLGGGLAWAK